jgi:hypothetical protein
MAKALPPITREQFRTRAKPLAVVINGKEMAAAVKEFSTGSLGWNISDKMQIEIDGKPVMVQIGLNLTIVGSKDLPQDGGGSSPPPAEPTEGRSSGMGAEF